jgi:plasmid stabilization system protein ParE
MSLPIYLTEEALQEEAEAYLFYEDKTGGLGERFLIEVEKTLAMIVEHPSYYSFSDATKTIRDTALPTFPFVIIYEDKNARIEVYHIHHTKKEIR